MDFPKKQQQCLIPRYLLQYLTSLEYHHTDPTAEWGGGGSTYTAGDGITISDEDVISIDNTVALKTDLLDYVTSTDLAAELLNYAELSDLATVATTGSYNDLLNKPTIPTDTSDLTNGAGYITSSALSNYVTTDTAQEITGAKVFKGSYKITCQSTENEGASVAFKASSQSSSDYPIGVMEIDERLKVMKFSVNGVVGSDYLPALGYYGGNSNYNYVAKLPKGSDKYRSISSGDIYLPLSVNKTKADSSGNINLNIPSKTSDLNNDSGYITSSALTGYATETWVTNQGYSTFSGSYNDLTDTPSLATVATSGSYNDLTNKPTIPSVSGTTSYSDALYWSTIKINNTTANIPSPSNFVTLATDQEITGTKTLTGAKKLGFKQSNTSDVIGFTAYDHNNYEVGNLQIANRNNNGIYVTLGNYTSEYTHKARVGFRLQPDSSSNSYNFIMPYGTNSQFLSNGYIRNGDTTIPCAFTDGTTTINANATGLVDLSSLNLGASYTAGTGIDITNDTISIDNTVALKSEIPSTATSTSTSTVSPSTIQLTFTFEDDTTQTVTLMTGATVSTTTTTTLS